jgi:3-phenylpropionate/cinnamic acid dioxygenase small subunit
VQAEQSKAKEVAELRAERSGLKERVAALESQVRALESDKAAQRHLLDQHKVLPPLLLY